MELKSIYYGNQNFFFCEADETEDDFDYVGYQSRKGEVLIARYAKDGTTGKYYLEQGDFDTIFANRKGTESYTYVYPKDLEKIMITDL